MNHLPEKSRKGFFITLEGGEGVGKSTLISHLSRWLAEKQIPYHMCREPGGTETGEKIRQLFSSPVPSEPLTPQSELYLLSAARNLLCTYKIKPLLEQGNWVISDRFFDSTLVYQGVLGKIPADLLTQVIHASTGGLVPDLTFLVDCPTEIATIRLQRRNNTDGASRFDQAGLEQHRVIREAFLEIAQANPRRFAILDGSLSPTDLFAQCIAILKERGPYGG